MCETSWQMTRDSNQLIKGKHVAGGKQALVHMVPRRLHGEVTKQLLLNV